MQNPRRFLHVGRHLNCDTRLPCRHTRQNSPGTTPPPLTREKTRPARHKPPIVGHFSCAGRTFSRSHPPLDRAGRTFSRTGSCDVTTLKPTTPLQPLMQTNVKPASPLQPKNAPKTPISHPQRRRRFHSHTCTSEQRRRGFQTDMPNNISTPGPTGVEGAGGTGGHGRASRSTTPSRRLACGDLAGGRARRRPEHPWGHKQTSRKTTNQEGPEGLAAVPVGGGRARGPLTATSLARLEASTGPAGPGRASRPRTEQHQRPRLTGVEGAGGTGGHGRASRRGAERSEDA